MAIILFKIQRKLQNKVSYLYHSELLFVLLTKKKEEKKYF